MRTAYDLHEHGGATWPEAVLPLAIVLVTAVVYGAGVLRLARSGRRPPLRHLAAMYSALVGTVLALVAMDAAASRLLSSHMAQHLLLMVVVAPLTVYARPRLPLLVAMPRRVRRAVAKLWTKEPFVRFERLWAQPLLVALLFAAAVWAWHLPTLYQSALTSEAVHASEHISFLATSVLFWLVVARRAPDNRLQRGRALAVVFATALQSAALGAVLTFATSPLYPIHALRSRAAGLDPLEDQQLAGVLMWIPPGVVYLVVMVALLWRWFAEADEHRRPVRTGEGT